MKLSSSKRRLATAAVVMLLCLFLLRPGASHLKARIANSISRAVDRPVEIGSVQLRFLPRPGFDLNNLVIYEDPAFGAEPMLRAPEVAAVVRFSSLVRGRLDISRLELTEPSLNLVRRQDGRWNWEALLERTARVPLAPTAKSKSEGRPGFPYIEASSGRINFKSAQEKKPHSLVNADFALWQESENAWGVRLKAEPLRTDMNLSDTGVLRMEGTWQRAESLRQTPLQFSLQWDRAQLGQLSKLVSGDDKGWRGEVRLQATLSGIPAAMQVAADTSIDNFHRYDISSGEPLRLRAHCDGRYSSAEHIVREIFCNAPVGDGVITMHGDAGMPGTHQLDLSLNFESVPVVAVAQLARRAKKDLPADLISTGSVQGNFAVKEDQASARGLEFQGHGQIANLRLRSAVTKVEVALASIPFWLTSEGASDGDAPKNELVRQRAARDALAGWSELRLQYGPVPLALGRPTPAQVRGWAGPSGYGMLLRGEGDVSHTLRVASLFGLPTAQFSVEGVAQMDLRIAGTWTSEVLTSSSGFPAPLATGTAQLRNLRVTVRGLSGPVEISSAELRLLPDEARLEKLNGRAADAAWTGWVALPRGCGAPGACQVHFNLNTEEVGLSDLYGWLSSPSSDRPWYQMLGPAEVKAPSFLRELRASGRINVGRFLIHNVTAEKVSASLDIEGGKFKISDLRAELLGGKHRGDWEADYTVAPPLYSGSGTLTGVSLDQVADAMHDSWISGTAEGTYQLKASGADSSEFWMSAEGGLQFDLQSGILSHIALASDEGPLHISQWRGGAMLSNGKIEIERGKIISPAGIYEISGTASLGKSLDLKLMQRVDVKPAPAGALIYSITGTVAEPRVVLTPAPQTQAQLKP